MYELLFDTIIALIVAAIPLYVVATRKKWGGWHICLLLFWCVIVYGSFIEPRLLVTKEYSIDIRPPGAEGRGTILNVAVISDLHIGKYRHAEWLERVVREVNATHPDAVLLAGDLASSMSGTRGFAPLAKLESRFGTYAVLGNWDYHVGAVDVRRAVESYRVEVLTNESVRLEKDGAAVRLAGLDDFRYGQPDFDVAFADTRPEETKIVFAHEPDIASEAEVRGVPLVIAGHTHGGQVRLPFIGAVAHIPIGIGQQFDRGRFAFGPTTLFITPGIGESSTRARLFQPPEISLLRITY